MYYMVETDKSFAASADLESTVEHHDVRVLHRSLRPPRMRRLWPAFRLQRLHPGGRRPLAEATDRIGPTMRYGHTLKMPVRIKRTGP